jgi:hypothetical protein
LRLDIREKPSVQSTQRRSATSVPPKDRYSAFYLSHCARPRSRSSDHLASL